MFVKWLGKAIDLVIDVPFGACLKAVRTAELKLEKMFDVEDAGLFPDSAPFWHLPRLLYTGESMGDFVTRKVEGGVDVLTTGAVRGVKAVGGNVAGVITDWKDVIVDKACQNVDEIKQSVANGIASWTDRQLNRIGNFVHSLDQYAFGRVDHPPVVDTSTWTPHPSGFGFLETSQDAPFDVDTYTRGEEPPKALVVEAGGEMGEKQAENCDSSLGMDGDRVASERMEDGRLVTEDSMDVDAVGCEGHGKRKLRAVSVRSMRSSEWVPHFRTIPFRATRTQRSERTTGTKRAAEDVIEHDEETDAAKKRRDSGPADGGVNLWAHSSTRRVLPDMSRGIIERFVRGLKPNVLKRELDVQEEDVRKRVCLVPDDEGRITTPMDLDNDNQMIQHSPRQSAPRSSTSQTDPPNALYLQRLKKRRWERDMRRARHFERTQASNSTPSVARTRVSRKRLCPFEDREGKRRRLV